MFRRVIGLHGRRVPAATLLTNDVLRGARSDSGRCLATPLPLAARRHIREHHPAMPPATRTTTAVAPSLPLVGFEGLLDTFDTFGFGPNVQARESNKHVIIDVDVPRYRMDELTVTTDEDTGAIVVDGRRDVMLFPSFFGPFHHILAASSPLDSFSRTFYVSPSVYDVDKATTSLEAGVLSIIVPKRRVKPSPLAANSSPTAPVTLFGSADGVAKTTDEDLKFLRSATSTSSIFKVKKTTETPEGTTYECDIAPAVTKDHLQVTLLPDDRLNIAVKYERKVVTKRSNSVESATYSSSVSVPQGTKAADVVTSFTPGRLTVTINRPQANASPATTESPAVTESASGVKVPISDKAASSANVAGTTRE